MRKWSEGERTKENPIESSLSRAYHKDKALDHKDAANIE